MSTEEKTNQMEVAAPTQPALEPAPPAQSEPVEQTMAEPATADTAETEPKPADQKPVKEKKPRAPRKKKTTPTHPPYFEMIKEAITALNDNTGSSPYAIAKFMEEHHKDELPANYKKVLATQLKNFTAKGKLVKIRASFKLKEPQVSKKNKNKNKKPMTKEISKIPTKARSKRKIKAPAVMSAESTKKKNAKPSRAKKAKKTAQPKPKQPKSIKSGASKKANKAVAG